MSQSVLHEIVGCGQLDNGVEPIRNSGIIMREKSFWGLVQVPTVAQKPPLGLVTVQMLLRLTKGAVKFCPAH